MIVSEEDFPIHVSNEWGVKTNFASARRFCLILFLLIGAVSSMTFLYLGMLFYSMLAILIAILAIITMLLYLLSRQKSYKFKWLTIDVRGISISNGGKIDSYFWSDIQTIRIISTKENTGGMHSAGTMVFTTLQIKRKGFHSDDKNSGIISPEFGISIENLYALSQFGLERWGKSAST